jgi:hypothetical protein
MATTTKTKKAPAKKASTKAPAKKAAKVSTKKKAAPKKKESPPK